MPPRYTRTASLAFAAVVASCLSISAARGEDPFSAAIRPTDAKTPEEERRSFHVPPGFEVQLVVAEPEIQKPMNLAFDARGRLWVSGSTEYPFPAPADRPGRDSIRVLEDKDGDGRADKVTVFADGLNILIGLYPYKDGAIAFSIPFIYDFQDTDGDGRADRREALYGPLGFDRDTHGMNNAFRRGFDGWVYANHGWQNVSTMKGKDGSRIDIQGGNTYRVRPDGSRVEWFTHVQVNPFGMAFDPLGDLYNADWSLALRGLADRDPIVARAAVDAIGQHPRPVDVTALLELWHRTPDSDVHLRHAVRLALLALIKLPGTLAH